MGQRVLGLDIGSYSIKGAIFDVAFKTFNLTDLYESSQLRIEELDGEERIRRIREGFMNLIKENRINPHFTISSIPGTKISTRMLTLPFNRKKVDKVLPFELENYLPFSLDELVIDYHIISSLKNSTILLAVAVKKEVISNHLKIFEGTHIDPKMVDIDSFAPLSAYHTIESPGKDSVAIIDLGHSKTTVSIVRNGRLESTRTLLTAGNSITNALRMKMDLTYQQAEEVKIKHGILDTEQSASVKKEIKRVADIIKGTVDPLIEEIKQTIQSYRAQHTQETVVDVKKVSRIYLCGGTSLLRNIDNYFTHKTNIPTSHLHCFPPNHEISRKLGARERVMTQAISLGLKVAYKNQDKRISDINLRKDNFAFQHQFKNLRSKISFIGTWLIILVAFIMINFGIRYYKLAVKESQIEKATLKVMSQILEDYSRLNINSSSKARRIIEDRIRKSKEQIDILTAGLQEQSALGVLREISARIPEEITVDVQELNIFKNNITFRGQTDSFSSVDKMIASLSEYEPFSKVEKGEISDAPDPNKKKFSINITVGESRE